jgi:long-subunit fatty acid transport protein
MKSKIKYLFSLLFLLFIINIANAQYIEDALRFALPGQGTGARALGMGNAYIGVSDDFTATWWNPAGLAQIKRFELTGGLSNFSYDNDATFFGSTTNYSNSVTAINNLGFVFPFPTMRGSLVFAFGYNRTNNLTSGLGFEGFNPSSSIISSLMTSNTDNNIPYQIWLTDSTGQYTPINGNVNQKGEILEGGSIGNWTFSGAMDVAPNLSVGVSLYIFTGSYSYNRTFTETDTKNLYDFLDEVSYSNIDYYDLVLEDKIDGDYTGFGANFGFIYHLNDIARFGLSLKTPVSYTVKEDFSTKGTSLFDNNDTYSYKTIGSDEYDVTTPWVFGGGVSVSFNNFIVSGDLEWIDYTQLEFSNANDDIISLNKDIKNTFRSVLNYRAGLEYTIPNINLKVRGGYAVYPSAYNGDPSDYDRKQISFGLGYLVEESMMIDAAYSIGSFNTLHSNYDSYSITEEDVKTKNFVLTLSFRF